MLDLRPVGYVIGLLCGVMALSMLLPALADGLARDENWFAFAAAAGITGLVALGLTMAFGGRWRGGSLSVQQAFLATVLTWLILPVFGAIPFMIGSLALSPTDAFFEAMSGLTTTGSTVLTGLDTMSDGILLWRGLLQWFGGIGIIVFATAILPELQIGGMQFFKSESFDTFGKILPRAAAIAGSISGIYLALTIACMFVYVACGMSGFDGLVHAMTTMATGGFANSDLSFGAFDDRPAAQYWAVVFMMGSSLPYIRFVQFAAGSPRPLLRDPQVGTFLLVYALAVTAIATYRMAHEGASEPMFRASLFNTASILTGTGYASDDYGLWGPFPVMMMFLLGLVGGCTGSTCCSVKIFRYQILTAAIIAQIRRIHSPNGVFKPRYAGRSVEEDVIGSVMAFFLVFFLALACLTMALNLIGLDFVTSLSGAATAIANVGPGLGPLIGPSGTFQLLPDAAKWVLSIGMLLGRLELLSVLVMLTPAFWQR